MRLAFISTALLATSIAHASTPIDGWYAGVFGGYAYIPNNIDKTTHGVWRSDAVYQPGYDAGLNIGFKSTPMRYEGELTYLNANLKKFNMYSIHQTGVTGHTNAILAMANVYYDFANLQNCLQPYLGLGIGYGWVQEQLNSTGPFSIAQFKDSNTAFAYQAMGGLIYNFSENYALNLGYRYVSTTHIDTFGSTFQAQLANLGVVYRFDGNNYK